MVNAIWMVSHVDDDVRCRIERAIAAIAAAVHLRVRAKAGEQHDHRLKKLLFHLFSFQAAAGVRLFIMRLLSERPD